jgi:hypothetical protein
VKRASVKPHNKAFNYLLRQHFEVAAERPDILGF